MRKRKPSDHSTRKARSSPERSSTPAGHTVVGDVLSPRHQAAVRSLKTGEETYLLAVPRGRFRGCRMIRRAVEA